MDIPRGRDTAGAETWTGIDKRRGVEPCWYPSILVGGTEMRIGTAEVESGV